jgi:hypothetical protein
MSTIRNTLTAATIGLLVVACGQTDVAPEASQPVAASTPAPVQPPKPAPAAFDGTVTLSARLEGGAKPAVVGITNLPDGTLLMITLSRKQSSYSAQDKATVSGGAFRAGPFSQQGADLNPGKYTIDIGSPLAALQPASVQAAFGDNGSNLKGALVGPSPIGGAVVDYSTQVAIGGSSDATLDAAARDKAKQDLHQWHIDACDDSCRIVKGVAIKQGKPFDQDACYQQCLTEIPAQ